LELFEGGEFVVSLDDGWRAIDPGDCPDLARWFEKWGEFAHWAARGDTKESRRGGMAARNLDEFGGSERMGWDAV
jgi:hypothetical protein